MRFSLAFAALALTLSIGSSARADSLTRDERTRLSVGETIARPVTFADERADSKLVGGITYTVLDASVDEILPLFDDDEAYRTVMPRTLDAHVTKDGAVRHVAMRTGNAVVSGAYTLWIERQPDDGSSAELKFWLDRRAPHDIADAYGYFRFTPLAPSKLGRPRTLVTYAIAIDIGAGIFRDLFEERVRAASLTLPQNLVWKVAHAQVLARR